MTGRAARPGRNRRRGDAGDDGRSLTAVYTVAAPGGKWTADDNGTYTVTVLDGQVLDAAGTAVAGVSTTFAVNVAAPLPPVDDTFNGGSNPPAGPRAPPHTRPDARARADADGYR